MPEDEKTTCMTDGSPVTPDHREIDSETGQQKGYVALCPEERKKEFVRPLRDTYRHKICGIETYMSPALAETYASDPKFYSGTFCAGCKKHFPVAEFIWTADGEEVGT